MSRFAAWVVSLALLVSITTSQIISDRVSASYRKAARNAALDNEQVLLPDPDALRALSLGNESLAADLLWIKLIQYFGTGSPFATYEALPGYIQRVTALDPKFAYPYEFALLVLPFMNRAEEAEQLGLQAEQAGVQDGMVSFYMASNYHINLKDYKKAAEYYNKASEQGNAPAAAKQLAAIALSQSKESINDRIVAINFWETVIAQAKSDAEKERAEAWLEHMRIVYALELIAADFQTKNGRYPADVQELVSAGYLKSIPRSPIYRLFVLNSQTGTVTFDTLDRAALEAAS